ncbi:MAG: porin [Alphaproteobacteria bacterium]|nr:porin [Alphaproteobacteria bacterium]
MKKGLLGSTALVAATALTVGAASAAEAPTYKLSGWMNFQAYFADRDALTAFAASNTTAFTTAGVADTASTNDMYFGVDDAELTLNVSGTADNGLEYGFKIEFEGSPGGGNVADEARIQLGGTWGTLQLGDEDGAEDTMNYGGENLLGATGGWDGDGDDMSVLATFIFPTIAGDTSDASKITYYSPRFSGFQVGASYAPNNHGGDRNPADDTLFQNYIGLGANYDGSFGDVSIKASAVYASASYEGNGVVQNVEDISAFSVGGIVGFGPVSVGANFTDNGESNTVVGANQERSYWNVAAGFETGPLYLSAGYIAHTFSTGAVDVEPSAISVTADYSVAPGFGVYAEYTGYDADSTPSADASVIIVGANVSF